MQQSRVINETHELIDNFEGERYYCFSVAEILLLVQLVADP